MQSVFPQVATLEMGLLWLGLCCLQYIILHCAIFNSSDIRANMLLVPIKIQKEHSGNIFATKYEPLA